MGSSVAMSLLLIGFIVATLGGVESVATSDADQAAQECSVNGGECVAEVYRAFRGGSEETSPVCCNMMMEMSQNCQLLLFPDPNIFRTFKTYCAARYNGGDGSDTAPEAEYAGPPAPAPGGL